MSKETGHNTLSQSTSKKALVASIALPVLLLVLVGAIEFFTSLRVDEPKYDALFAINALSFDSANCVMGTIKPEVVKRYGEVLMAFSHQTYSSCHGLPRIFRFNVQTGRNEEIVLDPTIWPDPPLSTEREIVELDHLSLRDGLAPDGYEFEVGTYRTRPSFLFFQASQRHVPLSLQKDGRRIRVPVVETSHYYSSNHVVFLGWVLE